MTKRKNNDLQELGYTIRELRTRLTLKKDTRNFFLNDRVIKGLIQYEDISEKTLMNIETGYTLPNLSTLKILATALEIDFIELIKEIEDHIP
ncbi:XRE family transcriptional regulator [Staphylococcus pseudintermedius]|uniref:helix-turn-helix domain-containing protein n=1 Tax=Staphylococcus pseudintermedius TaxID=283734 RepID=UPI001F50C1E4|nr:XRE family transcriptional regulator [Staphylococcus pseudintermedius]MDE9873148.1 XRE family transcriptional regulator [Staphylococcus pseudintermedius]MDE9900264.1 XRE family transcriptional regulator [Staphylococcus pseudintermedius]MDE9902667.1 XRE family transcriptional regulator [Staphylococcus pseudintermedius]MDF0152810.1 XRE family transcriptional regulator [Staphylococcus pseudintermedius]MDF0159204.1 XRE family transcriptional regulator [Staphylococcus pseudintermedius]